MIIINNIDNDKVQEAAPHPPDHPISIQKCLFIAALDFGSFLGPACPAQKAEHALSIGNTCRIQCKWALTGR
jgi:hypothetical protein